MRKSILLANGDGGLNLEVASYLLESGHRLAIAFRDEAGLIRAQEVLEPLGKPYRGFVINDLLESRINELVEEVEEALEGLDVIINGLPLADEEALLEKALLGEDLDAYQVQGLSREQDLGAVALADFQQVFYLNKAVARSMLRKKAGEIVFLSINDRLHSFGFPASPIANQGRISLMKSMAKELAPFRINVNSLSFGVFDLGLTPQEKKALQKELQLIALKSPIPKFGELLKGLDMVINPLIKGWSGQNLQIGTCLEPLV